MSKFQDYVPQALGVYKELFNGDRHYQNYNLEHCKGDKTTFVNALANDATHIVVPVFVIKRPAGGPSIGALTIRRISTGSTSFFLSPAHTIVNLDDTPDWEAIVFTGEKRAFVPVADEFYEFSVTDGTNTWYTEIFRFVPCTTINAAFPPATLPNPCGGVEWLQLVWSNPDCNISETIPAEAGFNLNLQVSMAQPKYDYKPDLEDDGEGGKTTTFQRLDKRFEFFILAPEYIADALASVQMFRYAGIVFQYGDTINCNDVEVEVDWETPCFAKITFRFTSDFLVKTACC